MNGGGQSPRWDQARGDALQFDLKSAIGSSESEQESPGEGNNVGIQEQEKALVLEVYNANTLMKDHLIGRCNIGKSFCCM